MRENKHPAIGDDNEERKRQALLPPKIDTVFKQNERAKIIKKDA